MSIGSWGPGGPGDWDDLFARFFGAAEPRRAQRIDITKYMSNEGREVLSDAARRAAELTDEGRPVADLDTDHLLWAVLQQDAMTAAV
jgi:ATP-dependent Clp protease ATP-binding subunit ClpC